MQFSLRRSRRGDEQALRAIWKICFADTDEYINSFFGKLYGHGRAVVAEAENKAEVCSAMYVLEPGASSSLGKCGYLYALGTLPEYRGYGIGAAVSGSAAELTFDLGFDICITCPAEPGLFDFYRKLGFSTFSKISRQTYSGESSCSFDEKMSPISVYEYNKLREKLLPEDALRYNSEYMQFLSETLKQGGGGLFASDSGRYIAAVERGSDYTINIKEFLGNREYLEGVTAHLMRRFGANNALVTLPAGDDFPASDHTLAIYRDNLVRDCARELYFPFTLD